MTIKNSGISKRIGLVPACVLLTFILLSVISTPLPAGALQIAPDKKKTAVDRNKQDKDWDQLKSEFIKKFPPFITWPNSSGLRNKSQPFIIKVIGSDSFARNLSKTTAHHKLKHRTVQVTHIRATAEIPDCHVLVIGSDMVDNLTQILEEVRHKPILTISDREDFGKLGVIINFQIVDANIRFIINVAALKGSGLTATSWLYKTAYRLIDPKVKQEKTGQ